MGKKYVNKCKISASIYQKRTLPVILHYDIVEGNSKQDLEITKFITTEDLSKLRRITEDRDKWKEFSKIIVALHEANSVCIARERGKREERERAPERERESSRERAPERERESSRELQRERESYKVYRLIASANRLRCKGQEVRKQTKDAIS